MNYYYRSHATTHMNTRRRVRKGMKRFVKYAACLIVCLIVPAGYLLMQKDDSAAISEDFAEDFVIEIEPAAEISLDETVARVVLNPDDPWESMLGEHLSEKMLTVSSGDTLIKILLDAGLAAPDAYQAVNTVKEVFDPRKLRQGQELHLTFDAGDAGDDPVFQGLRLKLNVDRELQLINSVESGFQARELRVDLETRHVSAKTLINSSLYQAAIDANLPIDILMQMIRAYSYDVDFQRDIQPGDSIEVLYEEKVNEDGLALKSGAVLYASLHTRGTSLPIYRYETKDGERDFFDPNGKSIRKTLMVTPIDGARISSGYGMRRHPIQGYNRMHKGLDFAAPTGTPIMAAGNGVVEFAGRKGSYGNYIKLRHSNEFQTVYAHMSRYGAGIRSGVRVTQGQIIGYVGSTGASTGPHLHYEVIHRGKHVNPATVKMPSGRVLEGDELKRFNIAKAGIQKLYASLEDRTRLADTTEKPRNSSDS
jgi:murein DD-endopeptidase MepM/ murein hydrolase activator NlpD